MLDDFLQCLQQQFSECLSVFSISDNDKIQLCCRSIWKYINPSKFDFASSLIMIEVTAIHTR